MQFEPLTVGVSFSVMAPTWRKVLLGREKDERVNMFGFVPAAEKQRVRQLHATERTADAVEALVKGPLQPQPLVHTLDMRNYDGHAPWHPTPRSKGRLTLTGARWELHFGGTGEWVHGPMQRYAFTAAPTGPTSCRVKMEDNQDPNVQWTFDLVKTSAEQLTLLVAEHTPRQQTPSLVQHAAPMVGVADELAKLARLRDEGVLNDAEFESQKAKLLGNV